MSAPERKIEITIEDQIMHGLDELEVSYGEQAISNLVHYLQLLNEWNKTHNLTAIDNFDEMIAKHIFDSVSIKPYIRGASLLDVGSGAGLPGMILAILSPALEVTSIDARDKKTQFQKYVANKLKLKNFIVVHERVEDYSVNSKFPMIVARAFSSVEKLINSTKHLIAPNGRWLAMKGKEQEKEVKALKRLNYKYDTYAVRVPSLQAQRNLIVVNASK